MRSDADSNQSCFSIETICSHCGDVRRVETTAGLACTAVMDLAELRCDRCAEVGLTISLLPRSEEGPGWRTPGQKEGAVVMPQV